MCFQNYSNRLVLFVISFCLYITVAAQTNQDSSVKQSLISPAGFKDYIAKKGSGNNMKAKFDSMRKASTDPITDSLSLLYFEAEVHYENEALDHRHRVFEWQLSSSKYIFIVVNIIVLVGLMLSVWQFYLPIYKMNKMAKQTAVTKEVSHTVTEDNEKKETSVSTIKLGKDGVEITSPVIGLLILVISIAFFFMYIRYVYPVSEVATWQQTETKASK